MKNITCNYDCGNCRYSIPIVKYVCTDTNTTCNYDCANCIKAQKYQATYKCRMGRVYRYLFR